MEDEAESDKTHLFLAALCFLLGWLMSLSNPLITGLAVYGEGKRNREESKKEMHLVDTGCACYIAVGFIIQ